MQLVKAKCTECGAGLEVDQAKDAAICPFCGTAYIVERAIQLATVGIDPDYEVTAGILLKYKGVSRVAEIPGCVCEIGEDAFRNCKGLVEVVIPETVNKISDRAFEGCVSLKKVTMHPGVEVIGPSSFSKCISIADLTLPDTVKEISDYAFCGCSSLVSINLPKSLLKIGCYSFCDCESLITISIPSNVSAIGTAAFKKCKKLKEVHLPNGLTKLETGLFSECESLTSFEIPNSVTSLGAEVFSGTMIRDIVISSNVKKIGSFLGLFDAYYFSDNGYWCFNGEKVSSVNDNNNCCYTFNSSVYFGQRQLSSFEKIDFPIFQKRVFDEFGTVKSELINCDDVKGERIETKTYYYGFFGKSYKSQKSRDEYYVLDYIKDTWGNHSGLSQLAMYIVDNNGQIQMREGSVKESFSPIDDATYLDHILFDINDLMNDRAKKYNMFNEKDFPISLRDNRCKYSDKHYEFLFHDKYGFSLRMDNDSVGMYCYNIDGEGTIDSFIEKSILNSFLAFFFNNYKNKVKQTMNASSQIKIVIEDTSQLKI